MQSMKVNHMHVTLVPLTLVTQDMAVLYSLRLTKVQPVLAHTTQLLSLQLDLCWQTSLFQCTASAIIHMGVKIHRQNSVLAVSGKLVCLR